MPQKNFIMLSMDDSEIKNIANVVGNSSCKKILDYLANKEATETELASKLNIPMPTVHYNLQQLIKSSLVDSEKFHYSVKGREVSHYRLANKYIIITPKKVHGIKEKLKSILPIAALSVAAAGIIQFTAKQFAVAESRTFAAPLAKNAVEAQFIVQDSTAKSILASNIALWFLFGAAFVLVIYLIKSIIKKE